MNYIFQTVCSDGTGVIRACVALDFQKKNVMLLHEGNSSNSNIQSRGKVDAAIAEKTVNFL